MKTVKLLSIAAVLSAAFASFGAQAGVTTDAHGNVGYDTAEECDAAVLSGQAKFYETFTHKPPLKRAGEANVSTAKIRDLGAEYERGACDLGVGRKMGRDGVSTPLQGKYVPFSPDMPINVYVDANNKALRVSMAQCDNWFSGDAPRAVAIPAPVVKKEEPAPVVEAAPVIAAPVVMAKSLGLRPYVFGTVGAANDKLEVKYNDKLAIVNGKPMFKDNDTKFAGQVGLGLQFNKYLGAEAFYQTGAKHKFDDSYKIVDTATGNSTDYKRTSNIYRNQAYGARATLGTNLSDSFRVFAKAGAASVEHKQTKQENNTSNVVYDYKQRRTVPTAGLGLNYNFNDKLALRADYDHFFKQKENNGTTWKGTHYLGAGVQYKF